MVYVFNNLFMFGKILRNSNSKFEFLLCRNQWIVRFGLEQMLLSNSLRGIDILGQKNRYRETANVCEAQPNRPYPDLGTAAIELKRAVNWLYDNPLASTTRQF